MVSAKIFSFLSLVGAISAISSADVSVSAEFDLEPYKVDVLSHADTVVWGAVEADLKLVFPGVKCSLDTTPAINITSYKTGSDDCKTIQDGLVHIFPTIQCHGAIDWDILEDTLDSLGHLDKRQQNRGHVDQHHKRTLQEIATSERATITSCSRAARPGNCKLCAAGFVAAAVGEIGVCAAAAYAAAAATAGVLAPAAWAGLTACGVAVLGALGASLTGCWSR